MPFNQMLEAGQLEELPSHGNCFTWGDKRSNYWIQSRLDRCFGNKEWFRQFPCANQSFLDKRGSEHRPVLIKLIEDQESYRGWFRFDCRFLEIDGIQANVTNAWEFGSTRGRGTVSAKLKAWRQVLSRLKKTANLNSRDRIQQAEFELEREQSSNMPSLEIIHHLNQELVSAYRDEETFWWQKSKDKWLHEGDKNTRFFTILLRWHGLEIQLTNWSMRRE